MKSGGLILRQYLSFFPLLWVFGCVASSSWEKPGVEAAVRDKDLAECRQEIRSIHAESRQRDRRIAAAQGGAYPPGQDRLRRDLDAALEQRQDNRIFADCMQTKGYTNPSVPPTRKD